MDSEPQAPDPLAREAGQGTFEPRPFGETLSDLELDLRVASRPLATTRVLAGCLHSDRATLDETDVWSWTVSRRLQGLLAVTIATRGESWTPTISCESCGAPMDLPLRLGAFLRDQDPPTIGCVLDGERVEVVVPTGADQWAWLEAGADDPAVMLARLLPGGMPGGKPGGKPEGASIADERLAAIEAALAEADPLTVLEIETRCPHCDAENRLELDLEATCLALLAGEQPRLLDEIHALARAYHWSEAEIFAVPPARRRLYLDRIVRGTE